MDAPAQQSIENDSRGGEYHSSNRILRSSGKHVKAGRVCPPPSRAVAFDVVTQGKKLWRTLAGFRQLSARGATRGFRSREDQVSLATNRSRSAMFGEAGLFWRTKRWVLPTAPHFADWPPAAALGERQGEGVVTSPAREQCWGRPGAGESPGTRSISEPVARCIPAPRTPRARGGVSPGKRRGSWDHRGLLTGRHPYPLKNRNGQGPPAKNAHRGRANAPRGRQEQDRQAPYHRWRPEAGETRDVVLTTHDPCPSTGAESRPGRFIGDERPVGRIIRVRNYAAHTIVCSSTDVCRLLST